jgi:hypothetical protein
MKYIWLVLIVLIAGCGLNHNLQTSGKAPSWLYGIDQGYIITFGTGDTHEEARNEALSRVKEEVIKSVAVQVTYEEELTTQEDVNSFFQEFESSTAITSDYFEPIKGISTNKVSDYYWEEIKENGVKQVRYHIKYPFDPSELSALIADYERINAEWTAELRSVTSKETYKRAEDIFADLDKLHYLSQKLPNQRSKEARERYRLLEEMGSEIEISVLQNAPGIIRYQLTLYGRPISTEEKPDIRFSCPIKIEKVEDFKDQVQINYEIIDCPENKEQVISVRYSLDGFNARGVFSILRE